MKDYQRLEKHIRDKQAGEYEKWYLKSKGEIFDYIEKDLYASLASRLRPETILDLGCGTGRITLAVAPFATRTFAVDYSEESLAFLKVKIRRAIEGRLPADPRPNITPLLGNASERLDLTDSEIDLIVSCQVLQHMQPADLAAAMNECRRALKPKGTFALSVYNADFFRFRGVTEETDSNGLYFRRFSSEDIESIATEHGFLLKSVTYYRTLPSRFYRMNTRNARSVSLLDGTVAKTPVAGKKLANYIFAVLEKGTRK